MSSSSSFSVSTSSVNSIVSLLSSFRQFSINEIIEATDNFDKKNLLEKDPKWDMYLAEIYNGDSKYEKVCLSVKRFYLDTNVNDEFEKEVRIATEIQHPNIISLLGYCLESGARVLVYEYTVKGSLYDYVRKQRSTVSLSWKKRLDICIGAAYGLQYLHKGKGEFWGSIIHRDVKPSNILLDDNWVAKISGFDISHVVPTNDSVETNIKGTAGYFAPEYVRNRKISNKADVYAFGVVLFEVLCRKKPWDRDDVSYYPNDYEDLGAWAQGNVDKEIAGRISDDSLKAYTKAIGECLQLNPKKRPNMDQVVFLLETSINFQNGEGEPVRIIDPIAPRKAEVTTSASSSSSSELHNLLSASSCPQLSLAAIKEATDNFRSVVLGKGGEALVYKAEIHLNSENVRTPVAVKKLFRDSSEFEKEILTLSKIRHPNIVSLLGYCNESDEKILIYEYMGKGSLAAFVKKDSAMKKDDAFCLTWEQRLKICLDVANGLQHLHEQTDDCKKGMIHRDVKPANILLDENLVAKVSDFGLLKLSSSENNTSMISNNNSTGTRGYLAPEYVYFGRLSTKFDVYSFGMVMFEVLCRKKKWDLDDDRSNYSYMNDTEDIGLLAQQNVDKLIKDDISYNSLKIFTGIIADCLRRDPKKRPTMAVVVRSLKSALMFQNNHLKDVRVSEFDMSEIESPFSISNELEKVHLDHELKAEYFGSMFADIDNPLPDFHTAIFSWDASTVKIDALKDVIRSCPTEDEMEKLKNYNEDKEMLGKREQFFLELAKVPRLESKLGLFCFSITLYHQVNDIRQTMDTVNIATIEVKGSKKLHQVIQIIGTLRNSQNQGKIPGFDQKFRLGSLLELSNARSKSSKMTMMHFLCKHLTEKKPELLDFDKDLVHLEAAAELQVQYLAEKIQSLREGLQKVEQEVTASDNDGSISASFQKAMRSFLDIAEAEVNSLSSFYSEVRSNLDTLVRYFGEDPARYPFELVATSLLKFIRMFISENQLMTDLGNKKLEENP